MNKAEYAVYLTTPHWQHVRAAALERAEHRCQVCNADKRLDVHHRTYERVGAERDADLTVLCRGCHEQFHGTRKLTKSSKPIAKDNWSQLPAEEQERLRNEILALLHKRGPMTSKRMGSMLGRRAQVVGSALVDMRRRGLAAKNNNRWRANHAVAVEVTA